MSHRHHFNGGGEVAIVLTLAILLVILCSLCRKCMEDVTPPRQITNQTASRRRRRRQREEGTILVLAMPSAPHIQSIVPRVHNAAAVATRAPSPTEFTASAPSYTSVMQHPETYGARPARPPRRGPPPPETPPPPYPVTPPVFPNPACPAIQEEELSHFTNSRSNNPTPVTAPVFPNPACPAIQEEELSPFTNSHTRSNNI